MDGVFPPRYYYYHRTRKVPQVGWDTMGAALLGVVTPLAIHWESLKLIPQPSIRKLSLREVRWFEHQPLHRVVAAVRAFS